MNKFQCGETVVVTHPMSKAHGQEGIALDYPTDKKYSKSVLRVWMKGSSVIMRFAENDLEPVTPKSSERPRINLDKLVPVGESFNPQVGDILVIVNKRDNHTPQLHSSIGWAIITKLPKLGDFNKVEAIIPQNDNLYNVRSFYYDSLHEHANIYLIDNIANILENISI